VPAAELFGGVSVLAEDVGAVFDIEGCARERLTNVAEAEAHAVLGDDQFAQAWARGAATNLDDLITSVEAKCQQHVAQPR
jgi:hypothetical protein